MTILKTEMIVVLKLSLNLKITIIITERMMVLITKLLITIMITKVIIIIIIKMACRRNSMVKKEILTQKRN